ncbi:DNA-packaging protein [Bradyrhizobium ottawaense]|uniref:terminase small subunit n=1 Tax=Bradyrhizobium ottawaense TaxID=931866 RepID=UPI000BE7D167|nr:terminase small subunit [Bradyrhizobium ottawaense]PDT71723.1 DNA-packaging protein [Bradyrhizobium ottawaense]
MAAPIGNKFWEARSSHGRAPVFGSPDELWKASCEYFEWVEANPLYEAKAFAYQGEVTVENLPKMRAMTIASLCIFLDISVSAWHDYKAREDFVQVTIQIEQIIRQQKFSGAAADLLNANIIARDLGLADKQELSGPGGKPIETKDVSARDLLASRIAGLAARTGAGEGSGGTDGSAG